jgi:hypothetical protein
MLLYKRETKEAFLKVWPELDTRHNNYSSIIACFSKYQEADFEERAAFLMADFIALVVRDGFDPVYLHKVLLPIAEWRSILALDIEGAT